MTRKILKFFAIGILFMIVFLACRADNEEISNPKDENSEFVSKSLWKEDEIYIKNVMKIYDTHEKEIQKKIGNPHWNYAMTFGNFDESFLRVPILKEDRVIGVLQVKRRKGNNKVYFNYDDSQNDINFFQTYIFDKRGKKPRENIIKLTGGENAKLATVTCVTASF